MSEWEEKIREEIKTILEDIINQVENARLFPIAVSILKIETLLKREIREVVFTIKNNLHRSDVHPYQIIADVLTKYNLD